MLASTTAANSRGDVREATVDDLPLAGMTTRAGSSAPAAALAGYLLADLGADVREAHAAEADLVDVGRGRASGAVLLSPFGRRGRFADAPAHHSAVEAIG